MSPQLQEILLRFAELESMPEYYSHCSDFQEVAEEYQQLLKQYNIGLINE